jgi:hypothetical protein
MEHDTEPGQAAGSAGPPDEAGLAEALPDEARPDEAGLAEGGLAATGLAEGGLTEGVETRAASGTGEPRVDAALRLLDRLPGLPVSEHPELFEQVHAQLTEVLGELDSPQASPQAS